MYEGIHGVVQVDDSGIAGRAIVPLGVLAGMWGMFVARRLVRENCGSLFEAKQRIEQTCLQHAQAFVVMMFFTANSVGCFMATDYAKKSDPLDETVWETW
jgi:hypothetical protein